MNDTTMQVNMTVNGESIEIAVAPRTTLADLLRGPLGLTGTHLGCEQGVCGACTVLLEGAPVRSCLLFAYQADGAEVRTIEGLAEDGELHPLQELFLEKRAFQCGFCTPGILMGLVGKPQGLDREGIRDYLGGFVCRCTGYEPILAAAEAYVAQSEDERPKDGE